MTRTIDFISLGCSKNLVDSENLMGLCEAYGFRVTHDSDDPQGDVVVINTCGFIADAKEESINMILELCEAKRQGRIRELYVMGCLSERYFKELNREIPEVDKFYGKFNWTNLLADLGKAFDHAREYDRRLTTPRHYAYVKIAEGCDRQCAYCSIPLITGVHKSRPMESIVSEVKQLVGQGVKEFQIIAQEITFYGIDLYGKQMIAELVRRISDVKGVQWIRLHYAYPTHFPWELLEVMRERENVCNYLDVALQHISTKVLTNMQRHVTKEETYQFVERLRREVPGIHLRTTLMVGFPGETEGQFEELLDFIAEAELDYVGVFPYSQEDGTKAAAMDGQIDEDTKQERAQEVRDLSDSISAARIARRTGSRIPVLVLGCEEDGQLYGRAQCQAPDVDGITFVHAGKPGEIVEVEVTGTLMYEMEGE
mgnify:CR=1 FL=1